ncbi:aminotransferase class IV [Marinicauda sp. Alg238-R41]|uniref:aminotransferase class IV n=1 Tax=Marinicauda sp. Alg238-R41 TaxID=2993447 RepID=UPI0022E1606B|nr:aminotransferase class IV [Marinicauda sp. Alg238-R41]
MSRVWLNGHLVEAHQARIDPADRGFLLGDGAFETMRFEAGRIRRWPAHRSRLSAALDILQIAQPDWLAIEDASRALADANALTAAILRLTITRGPHGRGMDAVHGEAGTVLMTALARPDPPVSIRLEPVSAPRRDPASQATRFKPIGYGDELHARRLARSAAADMALLHDGEGHPSCADCANVMWIAGNDLVAPGPEAGALSGTTRAALLERLSQAGLTLVPSAQLALERAEAVLVCNAVQGVVAVRAIGSHSYPVDHWAVRRLREIEAELD